MLFHFLTICFLLLLCYLLVAGRFLVKEGVVSTDNAIVIRGRGREGCRMDHGAGVDEMSGGEDRVVIGVGAVSQFVVVLRHAGPEIGEQTFEVIATKNQRVV